MRLRNIKIAKAKNLLCGNCKSCVHPGRRSLRPVFLQLDGGKAEAAPARAAHLAAYYDPPIQAAGLVIINGKSAGALWHPPYRLDVSKLLKPGVNHIEIDVYNTALNAWSALPPHDFKPLIAKYGDKFQMHAPEPGRSRLLWPVRSRSPDECGEIMGVFASTNPRPL